jgi:hypothetical protein
VTRAQLTAERQPAAEVDWDSLGFGLTRTGSVRPRLPGLLLGHARL